jgi:mgtE-like transporter
MRRGLGRVFAYWRAERRTINQGFVALVVASFGNLAAGAALGSITGTLQVLPGLMVLLPAAIGMRGNIFGALGSRLGTGIHTGLFEVTRRRQGILYQNVFAATVLTFSISFLLGVVAKTLSVAFGVRSMSVLDFVVISMLGGLLSSVVVGAFTVLLSIWAQRRGWDLDSVAAPLVTAAGDIVTIPALYLATFAVGVRWVTPTIGLLAALVSTFLTVRGFLTDLDTARRVIRESLPILFVAAVIDVFAGLVMQARLERFVTLPALLVLIPPFLEKAGSLGGILSSRLASKLHLGVLSPRVQPEALALLDSSIIFLFSVVLFALIGITTIIVAAALSLAGPGALKLMGISMLAGFIATISGVGVAYYTAVATFRRGLDPDNFGIPLITSSMDFVGVIALIIALVVFGVA